MSSITNLTPAPAALPSLNLHAHGHKKGVHGQADDSAGATSATQASAGSTQNLFSRLLQSLETVMGVQLSTAASAAPRAGANAGAAAPAAATLSAANISIKA
jgi:hypothetical protein